MTNLPHAVIIAGGQGQRLGGVRKADLRIGGRRLLDRVIDGLGPVEQPVVVATGPAAGPTLQLPAGAIGVADIGGEHTGPLAGIAAAVVALRARGVSAGVLVSVAVDTPLLPADYVTRLLAGLGEASAAFALWGEDFYPTNAAWRIEAIADLPEQMMLGAAPASPKALLPHLNAVPVDWKRESPLPGRSVADLSPGGRSGAVATPPTGGNDPFANVNTVSDLIALERRLKL